MVIAAMTASSLMCFIKLFVFNVKIMISQPLPFRFCLWAGKKGADATNKKNYFGLGSMVVYENVSTMKPEKMRADLSCSPKRIFSYPDFCNVKNPDRENPFRVSH